MSGAGVDPAGLGRDDETLRRIGAFVELHVEQGRALVDGDAADRGGVVDLAARPLAAGPARPGRPRRHHPPGRPRRTRCSTLADDRPGGPRGGRAARSSRHRRQGPGAAERGERDPVGGHRLARRPRARRGRRPPGRRRGRHGLRDHAGRGVVDAVHRLRRRTPRPTVRACSGTPRCCRPARATTPASWPQPASRPRCSSSAIPTGVSPLPRRARRARRLPGRGGGTRHGDRGPRVLTTWWCEHAQLDEGPRRAACASQVDDGRITAVERSAEPAPGDEPARGRRPPRASPTRTRTPSTAPCAGARTTAAARSGPGASAMYAVAARLDPDSYLALARAIYAEMALAGVTCVGEFHYLHHGPGGTPYDDPNAMAEALVQAAADAGIRLTLLDACYLAGGLEGTGHAAARRRPAAVLRRRRRRRGPPASPRLAGPPGPADRRRRPLRAGGPRRAARPPSSGPRAGRPLHVHLSEQPAENERLRRRSTAARPPRLLADRGVLGPDTTAVHATHLTGDEIAALGASGTRGLRLPDHRGDLADGIGPCAGCATPGPACVSAATSTPSSTCSRRRGCSRPTSG